MNSHSDPDRQWHSSVEEQFLCDVMEELTQQAQNGQTPDLEAYVRKYPQFAGQLRQMSLTLTALADLGRSHLSAASPVDSSGDSPLGAKGILGDYRILREVGRGGMGVVYEAEQISLGRHVALKILPLAAVFDQRQLRRFRNEAQAAANLHHQNIVPVFGVGCERGVHYYAMQFIEGRSLDTIIRELRQQDGSDIEVHGDQLTETRARSAEALSGAMKHSPIESDGVVKSLNADTKRLAISELSTIRMRNPGEYYRSIAQMMVQVAKALDYAHHEGVLHRDIKPSNLILDSQGKLWVTDFGLARMESQPGVTEPGDVLGTLGYMSPEQIMAKHGVVDHRTDIYALGATFYELLTLHRVFDASNRKAMIRQFTSDNPRAPRQLVRTIPRELEIIVMKALSKAPEERYLTAGDLADDLTQFLDDLPIRAKPPSLARRVQKWARRHRAVVATATVGLAMVLVASTLVLFSQKQQTELARRRAIASLRIAESALAQEREQRAFAEREGERATRNFELAQRAVDSLLTEVAESDLLNVGKADPLRNVLLNRALEFYRDLLQQHSDNDGLRRETALAYQRVGNIQAQLGNHPEAEQSYLQAVAHFQVLCDTGQPYQFDLAKAQNQAALHFKSLGQFDKASVFLDKALTHVRNGASQVDLSAEEQQSVEATIQLNTAILHFQAGRTQECEDAYKTALSDYLDLSKRYPTNDMYRDRLATTYKNLAIYYSNTGRYQDAEQMLEESLELRKQLVAERPDENRYQVSLALLHNSRAALFKADSRSALAEQSWQQSIQIWRSLVDAHPAVPQHRDDLASAYHNLGVLHSHASNFEDATRYLEKANALREDLVAIWPNVPEYLRNLALDLNSLGNVQRNAGDLESAESVYKRTLEIQRQLTREHPKRLDISVDLSGTLISYGTLLLNEGQQSRAHNLFERAQNKLSAFLMQQPNNVRALEFSRQATLGLELSQE